jgi:hypothetical protein
MYRLVAGPSPTKAEAVKVCEAIKADGAYCRVVAYES